MKKYILYAVLSICALKMHGMNDSTHGAYSDSKMYLNLQGPRYKARE